MIVSSGSGDGVTAARNCTLRDFAAEIRHPAFAVVSSNRGDGSISGAIKCTGKSEYATEWRMMIPGVSYIACAHEPRHGIEMAASVVPARGSRRWRRRGCAVDIAWRAEAEFAPRVV